MNLVKGLRFEKQVLQTEKGIQYFHDNLKKESAPQELGKVQIECRSSQKRWNLAASSRLHFNLVILWLWTHSSKAKEIGLRRNFSLIFSSILQQRRGRDTLAGFSWLGVFHPTGSTQMIIQKPSAIFGKLLNGFPIPFFFAAEYFWERVLWSLLFGSLN